MQIFKAETLEDNLFALEKILDLQEVFMEGFL